MIDLEPRETAAFEIVSNQEMENIGDMALIEALIDADELMQEKSKSDADKKTSDSENADAGSSLEADKLMTVKIKPLDFSRAELITQNPVVVRKEKPTARKTMKKGKSPDSPIDRVRPSDENVIDETKIETGVKLDMSDETAGDENRGNVIEPLEAPKNILQTDQVAYQNSVDDNETLPELPVSEIIGKRKKAPQAKNAKKAKKRKTGKGASVRV